MSSNIYRLYIGIGSNINDPLSNIQKALLCLYREPFFSIKGLSSLWQTTPVGYEDQPLFLNGVILIEVQDLPLEKVHIITQKIEQTLGKKTPFRNGPRSIDLDLLFAPQHACAIENLIIPHPRIEERLFVLLPLEEVMRSFPSDQRELFGKGDLYDKIELLKKKSTQVAFIWSAPEEWGSLQSFQL